MGRRGKKFLTFVTINWSVESSPLGRLNSCPACWTRSFQPLSYTQSCTSPARRTTALFYGWFNPHLEILHVVEDGGAWTSLLGAQERRHHQASWSYLKKQRGNKSGKSGGKTSQGMAKTVLEEGRRETKIRNKYPVPVDPASGRNVTLAPAEEAQKRVALDSPSNSPCWSPGNFSKRQSCLVGTTTIWMHCLCRPVCKASLTYKQIIMYSKYKGLNSHSAAINLMLPLHPP